MNKTVEQADEYKGVLDLVHKAADGDSNAFADLMNHPAVNQRLERLASHLARRGSFAAHMDVDDLKQEVRIKLFKKLKDAKKIDRVGAFLAWVQVLARNIYLDELRECRKDQKNERGDLVQNEPIFDETQSGEVARNEMLDKLKPPEQEILIMRMEGFTIREIAHTLNISSAQTHRRLMQIYKTFLGEIDQLQEKMKASQREIEREKQLTRHVISELRA